MGLTRSECGDSHKICRDASAVGPGSEAFESKKDTNIEAVARH